MSARRGRPARQERARGAIAALLVFVLLASVAWARPLTDQEKASLAVTVASFDTAMRDGDYARVTKTVPTKVIAAIGRRAGVSPDQILAEMIKAMQETLQSSAVKIEFSMDLGTAIHKELASGTPYVLIPTQTTVAVGGQRVRERGHTLALLDEGQWFLLRVNDALQLQILREVYPEFTGIEFPSGSMEALNP
jgi:transposase